MRSLYIHSGNIAVNKSTLAAIMTICCIITASLCALTMTNATYAQTCEPDEVRKFLPADGEEDELFGGAIAVNNDYIVIGAPDENDNELDYYGAAYVFDTKTGNQLRKLVSSGRPNNDGLGYSIALSGQYAAIGAVAADGVEDRMGAVYIFDLSTGTEINKIFASDGATDTFFGHSVAIEGTTLLVGAPSTDGAFDRTGAVYVYDLLTGTELAKLTASNETDRMRFGWSIAIHNNKALIGAYYTTNGAAYMFDLTTYTQIGQLIIPDPDPIATTMGDAVALNDNYAFVGREDDRSNGWIATGSVYVFNPNTGNFISKITASDIAEYMSFGASLSLNDQYLAVGSPNKPLNTAPGKAYLFDFNTGEEIVIINPSDGTIDQRFGNAITLHNDRLFVASSHDDDNGDLSGSAYEYDIYCIANPYLIIIPETLVSNEITTFSCSNMNPNEATYLLYSLSGLGAVFIPQLNVVTDLKAPILGASKQSDALGNCSWTSIMPTVTHSYDVWFQTLQFENLTRPVRTEIIP